MATYRQIQSLVKAKEGFEPKTCWIADVKSEMGLTARRAWNRTSNVRSNPCPPGKRDAIRRAILSLE
jgi:hypothetical protein